MHDRPPLHHTHTPTHAPTQHILIKWWKHKEALECHLQNSLCFGNRNMFENVGICAVLSQVYEMLYIQYLKLSMHGSIVHLALALQSLYLLPNDCWGRSCVENIQRKSIGKIWSLSSWWGGLDRSLRPHELIPSSFRGFTNGFWPLLISSSS